MVSLNTVYEFTCIVAVEMHASCLRDGKVGRGPFT